MFISLLIETVLLLAQVGLELLIFLPLPLNGGTAGVYYLPHLDETHHCTLNKLTPSNTSITWLEHVFTSPEEPPYIY